MSVSDYLGSRKCNLHKPSTPVDYPRPVSKRRCLPHPNNPVVPVRPENRRRDIDLVFQDHSRKMAFLFWCIYREIQPVLKRRLVRKFLKWEKANEN